MKRSTKLRTRAQCTESHYETESGGRTFDSAESLLAWLRDETHDIFVKDHAPAYYPDMLADTRFLAAARHAFLIRRPEEIAASSYALSPSTNIESIGLERLYEAQHAIRRAGRQYLTLACGRQRQFRLRAARARVPEHRG